MSSSVNSPVTSRKRGPRALDPGCGTGPGAAARRAVLGRGLIACCATLIGACNQPGGPDVYKGMSEFPSAAGAQPSSSAPGNDVPVISVQQPLTCAPAQASQMMPGRSNLLGGSSAPAPTQASYFTDDLYNLFKSICGGCHVESNLGNFTVARGSFSSKVDETVYEVITSDDKSVVMPPVSGGGEPFSTRAATDPVALLAKLLRYWLDQGSPDDLFTLPLDSGLGTANTPQSDSAQGYTMTVDLSAQLTNIGTCIPDKRMVASSQETMDAKDALFAQATALPPTLDQTDLTTLDSATLATTGVISYAPTYPLWTDDAGKMRYVRVPRGQSIVFHKDTQQFSIPPNTRFYKTFLKRVNDVNGNTAWRKIETRVIVSRPDTVDSTGAAQQNALYGTYVWNDDESQATLLADPLRNGKPFADRIFSYITDEQKAQSVTDGHPTNLAYALDKAGVTRHYLLPGAERCVQCHQGSPSESFILGFTPLQVSRRPTGQGGVYEPAGADELTQLQRLLDYGVITGVDAAADVLPLEQSEGARAPRNAQELAAQAYMVGNCAHCHNPRGYPSVKQPLLKDVLVFLPGPGPRDGIFQMSLDLMSPVRKRGAQQNVPMPYITPSLYDYPSFDAREKFFCPNEVQSGGACADGDVAQFVLAPWRSLIYRNVDTPYDYFDDYVPFPHMPLNSPGYDCRAAAIMGDWMVSIPAVRKDSSKVEAVMQDPTTDAFPASADMNAQPYQEVAPGDAKYADAVATAQMRLDTYHNLGFRYGFCPSTYTDDVVDPIIQDEADRHAEVVADIQAIPDNPAHPTKLLMPALAPIRPHLVPFDDTDPPGDWFPRRPDWEKALVNANVATFVQQEQKNETLSDAAVEDLTNVLNALKSVRLDDQTRADLVRDVPFGLWDTSIQGCNFAGVPTVASLDSATNPDWVKVSSPPPSAPVYMESPGGAIFRSICFNCHGVNADSKGLLADEITNITGGDARVANFRDGLFGKVETPGSNRELVFGPDAVTLGIATDDLAARYVAWMALGGTSKHLPVDVLNQVSLAPVLGQTRSHVTTQGTPDMLRLGLDLCGQIVLAADSVADHAIPFTDLLSQGRYKWSAYTGLIDGNGDAELWLKLCSLNNRPIVRVIGPPDGGWKDGSRLADLNFQLSAFAEYWATSEDGKTDFYGTNPVLDHHGNVTAGIKPDNYVPVCVRKPSDDKQRAAADAVLAASKLNGNQIPYCPDALVDPMNQLQYTNDGDYDFTDGRKWAARGAVNAALAVFSYLDEIERDPSKRKPLYNQCNLLGQN